LLTSGKHTCSVHFDGCEPLLLAGFRTVNHIVWLVASDPAVNFAPISNLPTKQLPYWHSQTLACSDDVAIWNSEVDGNLGHTFDIPQGDIQSGKRGLAQLRMVLKAQSCTTYHKDLPAAVEAGTIRMAPYVFDVVSIPAHKSLFQFKECSLYCFSMTL
jgi:hypothetical protein